MEVKGAPGVLTDLVPAKGRGRRAEQFVVVLKMLGMSAPVLAATVFGSGFALHAERVPELIGQYFVLTASVGWMVFGLFLLSWGKRKSEEIDRKYRPWMYRNESKDECYEQQGQSQSAGGSEAPALGGGRALSVPQATRMKMR